MLSKIIGNKEEFSLQHRIYNTTNFAGLILTIMTVVINYSTGFTPYSFLFLFFSMFIFAGLWIYSLSSKNLYLISRLSFSYILFVFFPLYWFIDGGTHGGFQYFTMFFLVIMLTTMPGNKTVFIVLFYLIIISLIGIEFYYPELAIVCPTRNERYIDIIISNTLTYFFIIVVLNVFIKLYKKNNRKIIKQKEELEAIREELRKANAELLEMNKTKDKFFSIIAHDLKNPFNSLLGFSQLLIENHRQFNEKERESIIKTINKSAQGAFTLLKNLLTWSQSQSGKIEYLPEEINLKELVTNVIFEIGVTAKIKDVNIVEYVNDDLTVFADKNMITIVLINLISNAIKFTQREGTIVIKAKKQANSSYVELSVEDNGIGIEKEKIDALFRIDENISTLGTERETGTGLGLILCKEFIEKHQCKIWVESEINKGSKFVFTIPLIQKK